MAVRRKSNWYIYFISFAIALVFAIVAIFAFRWYLFPEQSDPVGLDKTGELDENFRPTSEQNFNMLAMLADKESDHPELFMLVEYNAVENRVTFVPLPNGISMPSEDRTLPNVYAAQGGGKVVEAVEKAVGVNCDFYAKMDRTGFINLITVFGNVNFDMMDTVIIYDGSDVETVNAGTQRLTAETLFRLMMLADYGEGESYRFNCIGSMLSELVNQNFRSLKDSSLLDNYFRMITDYSDTNLTEQTFKSHKAALLNTAEYGGVSPAEYYIPYGEYGDDGSFVISENSITTIQQKAGLI